jgi:hypothetical protein
MNERIEKLMIEAGARFEFLHGVHYDDFQYEKFAQLIVKQCMDIARNVGNISEPDDWALDRCYEIEQRIQDHFGVEE